MGDKIKLREWISVWGGGGEGGKTILSVSQSDVCKLQNVLTIQKFLEARF